MQDPQMPESLCTEILQHMRKSSSQSAELKKGRGLPVLSPEIRGIKNEVRVRRSGDFGKHLSLHNCVTGFILRIHRTLLYYNTGLRVWRYK